MTTRSRGRDRAASTREPRAASSARGAQPEPERSCLGPERREAPVERVSRRSHASGARGTIRTKYLAALISSWIASPLSIVFAHLAGFANAPAVLVTLLAAGALAPIQVLVNEALVPAVVVRGGRIGPTFEAALCVLQAATIGSVFLYGTAPAVGAVDILLAVVAGTIASHFSTRAATIQLEAILAGTLRHRTVMLVSALPGLLTLLVFLLLGLARLTGVEVSFRIVYATIVLPAVGQCFILEASGGSTPRVDVRDRGLARVSSGFLVAAVVLFGAASAAAAARAGIAGRYERVVALVLVALNSTFALSFTFSKILFLERNAGALMKFGPALVLVAVLATSVIGMVRHANLGPCGVLAMLVALQFAMTSAISATRELVHESP